jgi:hypothetical protein
MSKKEPILIVPPEIRRLVLQPVLLSTEDPKRFEELLVSIAQSIGATNPLGWLAARRMAVAQFRTERTEVFEVGMLEAEHQANMEQAIAQQNAPDLLQASLDAFRTRMSARRAKPDEKAPETRNLPAEANPKRAVNIDKVTPEQPPSAKVPTDATNNAALAKPATHLDYARAERH